LSQSPLVTAVGQDGQLMAHAPSFVHWVIEVAHLRDRNKAREQTSIFHRLFVSYKSLVSCLLAVAYTENFHGGFHLVAYGVICIWCALFVTS